MIGLHETQSDTRCAENFAGTRSGRKSPIELP